MPKVLRILNRFNLGGPSYNVGLLSKHMAPEFETLLIGGGKDESEETSLPLLKEMGLSPIVIPGMKRSVNPFSDLKAYYQIKHIIQKTRPDIVHTHGAKAGFIGRIAANQCKVPVIIHTFHGHVFHSYFNAIKTTVFKTCERYAAQFSNGIIALSENQKSELSEVYQICAPEKITVIPLGLDLLKFQQNTEAKRQSFRNEYQLEEEEIAIGIIGRLVPVKNHALFLNALKIILKKTDKKIRAFIIGDGEERRHLENLSKKLKIEYVDFSREKKKSVLTFTSWIKDIDRANAGLDIIALTSLNEGTPVSLIEAQAAGKPIVTTTTGGVEDIVIKGETALLSEPGNYSAFAENLLNLIENDALRAKMGVGGPAFVNSRFSYSRLIHDMKLYYFSLLEGR